MRKTLSIALLAFSLAMMSATMVAKRVHNFLRPHQQENIEEESFSPFGMLKKISSFTSSNEERPFLEITFEDEEPLQEQPKEVMQPIMQLELTEEEKTTFESYAQNPKLKNFIQELSEVISKEDIESRNYLQIAFKPEVRAIFMKYSQDPEFREIATGVMKDKDLLQLAQKITKGNEVQK